MLTRHSIGTKLGRLVSTNTPRHASARATEVTYIQGPLRTVNTQQPRHDMFGPEDPVTECGVGGGLTLEEFIGATPLKKVREGRGGGNKGGSGKAEDRL